MIDNWKIAIMVPLSDWIRWSKQHIVGRQQITEIIQNTNRSTCVTVFPKLMRSNHRQQTTRRHAARIFQTIGRKCFWHPLHRRGGGGCCKRMACEPPGQLCNIRASFAIRKATLNLDGLFTTVEQKPHRQPKSRLSQVRLLRWRRVVQFPRQFLYLLAASRDLRRARATSQSVVLHSERHLHDKRDRERA